MNWLRERVKTVFHLARLYRLLNFLEIDPVQAWFTDDQADENFLLEEEPCLYFQGSFEEDLRGGCRFLGCILRDEAF